ncbi:MAG: sulfurtransferase, partial [Pseudomonadota bacterium]
PGATPAVASFRERHIEGAVFFDIDDIADPDTDFPHMLPPPAIFAEKVGALGITDTDPVVVYDDQGVFSAARVWWTFRAMGHENVRVLNGGLPKWIGEGRTVTHQPSTIAPTRYRAAPETKFAANADDVRRAIQSEAAEIVDARPRERFLGAAPEPRENLRSGAMPGALNVPYSALTTPEGVLKSPDDLLRLIVEAGVTLEKPVITTCGSGVTAALLSLALETIGHSRHSLYDGSWTQWGDIRNDERRFPVVNSAKAD